MIAFGEKTQIKNQINNILNWILFSTQPVRWFNTNPQGKREDEGGDLLLKWRSLISYTQGEPGIHLHRGRPWRQEEQSSLSFQHIKSNPIRRWERGIVQPVNPRFRLAKSLTTLWASLRLHAGSKSDGLTSLSVRRRLRKKCWGMTEARGGYPLLFITSSVYVWLDVERSDLGSWTRTCLRR